MSSGDTTLTVYQARTSQVAEMCCQPCCFIHDDFAVVTDCQVRLSKAAFAALVLFYSFEGVPGFFLNRKMYLIGFGAGLGIGVMIGSLNGYNYSRIPNITLSRLFNQFFESHAAKKPQFRAIVLAFLLFGVIMRSIPPYDKDKRTSTAFFDGFEPGYVIGLLGSFCVAFKIMRYLEERGNPNYQGERTSFASLSRGAYAIGSADQV
jgi:hypothetical protein